MNDGALVYVTQSWDVWRVGITDSPLGIDQEICRIHEYVARLKFTDFNSPFRCVFKPCGANDLMLCLDIFGQAMLLKHSLIILLDLSAFGIIFRPIGVGLKAKLYIYLSRQF